MTKEDLLKANATNIEYAKEQVIDEVRKDITQRFKKKFKNRLDR